MARVLPFGLRSAQGKLRSINEVDPFAPVAHDLISVNPYTPKIITFLCRKIGWFKATELVWDCWIYISTDQIVADIEAMELERFRSQD